MSPSLLCKLAITFLSIASVSALPSGVGAPRSSGVKVVLGNDDGWAEANIRQFYADLSSSGYDVILSAPAYNLSGTSSLELPPLPVILPGEYGSIPAFSPAEGSFPADARINYVNAPPATAVQYGLNTLAEKYWGSKPDIVLAGPNVGSNLGLINLLSGTVGAADAAVQAGIPAIAFSADEKDFKPYTALTDGDSSHVYSQLALKITNAIIASGAPYLPPNTLLNVNFASVADGCTAADDFTIIQSRVDSFSDGITCDGAEIPSEQDVISRGCTVSVSAMDASKCDASTDVQTAVAEKLAPILSCF